VQAISNNQASWQDKAEVIANRFQQDAPAARAMVENAIMDLLNYENICYKFEDMELYDLTMRLIPYGNYALVQLPQNTKTRTKWIGFTLFVQPRLCDARSIVIEAQHLPPPVRAQVYIQTLNDPVTENLYNTITRLLLEINPKDLIELHDYENAEYILQQLSRYNHAPDMDTRKKWLDLQKAEAMYEGLCQITQADYVGKVEGMESLSQRLMRLKQNVYNTKTGKMECISVQELNKQYQMHLAKVDAMNQTETDHLPSLLTTFFQALSTQLREKLVEHLPAQLHSDYNMNLAFYNVFMQ
jgi:hypothetical protein